MRCLIALAVCCCLLASEIAAAEEARGVVYDFGATWCGPCQQVAPIVEKLQREGLPIQKVDIDQQRELASKYQVQQIPTFVLIVDGKEVDRTTGRLTEADLRRMVARIPQSAPQAQPAAAASPAVQSGVGTMAIPVELGEPAPLTRPAPLQTEPAQTRVAENDQKKRGLRDLLPFGNHDSDSPPAIVRGNDSSLAAADPTRSPAAAAEAVPSSDPMESSVRIRVITNGRIDLGSGTVISSKAGITQILTCAHIFKEFNDDSRIEVDVFEHGGTNQYTAGLIKFDATADLGLISIPTPAPISQTRVAGPKSAPQVGEPVAAIGCSGGEEPTRQQSRVTDIDKYEGPHNLLCTGVPVRGRSGGGLFNRNGEIIGVCSAADEQEQRGFYSGLLAIHKLLDEQQLSALYAPPVAAPAAVAAAPAKEAALANVDPAFERQGVPEPVSSVPTRQAPASTADAAPVDVQAGDAEVVVIIRDRSAPGAANRVVILHEASPKFMSYLSGELTEEGMNMDLMGAATTSSSVPAIARQVRTPATLATSPATGVSQLRHTGLSQPVVPQRYTRSSRTR